MTSRTAVLLGSSGLVGRACLERLLITPAYDRVTILVRQPSGLAHPRLREEIVAFDDPATAALLHGDDLFCCLGADLRLGKKTLKAIDHDLTIGLCRQAAENGMRRLLLVTSSGVGKHAVLWYCRMKAAVERSVRDMAFEKVTFLRPSLFLGKRSEPRTAEEIGKVIMQSLFFVYRGPLAKYRPIDVSAVATTMVALALEGRPGVSVIESDQIAAIASGPEETALARELATQ